MKMLDANLCQRHRGSDYLFVEQMEREIRVVERFMFVEISVYDW